MESPQPSADRPANFREMKWTPSEKAAARQAFDRALQREFEAVIQETKGRAAAIRQGDDLWHLEDYLREQRKQIDFRYDYRYSRLLFVFAYLLKVGRLSEQELRGLSEEKLADIRDLARR